MLQQFIRAGLLTGSPRSLLGSRVGPSVKVERPCTIIASRLFGDVTLGRGANVYGASVSGHVSIGRYTYLSGPRIDIVAHMNPVTIGNFCSVARGTQIQEYNHRTSGLTTAFLSRRIDPRRGLSKQEIESKGPIAIGHDVWIGANCLVVSGITIGTGAVVAAGAVVTRNVPPYAIVAGNPARVIRYRFEDQRVIDELLKSEWWAYPPDQIEAYRLEFEGKNRAV